MHNWRDRTGMTRATAHLCCLCTPPWPRQFAELNVLRFNSAQLVLAFNGFLVSDSLLDRSEVGLRGGMRRAQTDNIPLSGMPLSPSITQHGGHAEGGSVMVAGYNTITYQNHFYSSPDLPSQSLVGPNQTPFTEAVHITTEQTRRPQPCSAPASSTPLSYRETTSPDNIPLSPTHHARETIPSPRFISRNNLFLLLIVVGVVVIGLSVGLGISMGDRHGAASPPKKEEPVPTNSTASVNATSAGETPSSFSSTMNVPFSSTLSSFTSNSTITQTSPTATTTAPTSTSSASASTSSPAITQNPPTSTYVQCTFALPGAYCTDYNGCCDPYPCDTINHTCMSV